MEYKKIHYSVENGIAQITMDYMKNMNAIDVEMADELIDALAIAEGDTAVRTVVLAGSEKAFSAGGDIGYFYKRIQSGGEVNMDELLAKIEYLTDYMKKMDTMIVTSVSGPAAGAGVSLALSGDFLICADNAKFILAFVNLGLVPDTGATFLLTRSIGVHRTLELATTGRPVSAAEAKDWGRPARRNAEAGQTLGCRPAPFVQEYQTPGLCSVFCDVQGMARPGRNAGPARMHCFRRL